MLAGANYITVHKVASLFLRIAIDKQIRKLNALIVITFDTQGIVPFSLLIAFSMRV